MGQALTHGIYLPDEGERNCYNGLARNWQLLDGAVGTIAEHTTALSGKAPLVHTHTKSDITDLLNSNFIPSANNSYDLGSSSYQWNNLYAKNYYYNGTPWGLDKDNEWTGDNTFSGENTFSKPVAIERNTDTGNFLALKNTVAELGSTPASAKPVTIAYRDKNDENLGYMGVYYDTDGSNHFRLYVRNKYTSGAPSTTGSYDYAFFGLRLNADKSKEGVLRGTFRPYDNNTYDLGSSSYQWNNLYAKNYYYNGTAWGLDKDNTWSAEQTYSKNLVTTCTATPGVPPSTDMVSGFRMKNAEKSYSFVEVVGRIGTSGVTYANLVATNKFKNGNIDVSGSSKSASIQVGIRANGDNFIYTDCEWRNSLVPYSLDLGNVHLGTSTNKWKSLNGINPGALSLPNLASDGYIDLSDNISANTEYSYTPTVDGWLALYVQTTGFHAENAVGIFTGGGQSNLYRWACSATSAINLPRAAKYHGAVMLPVKAGLPYLCWITIDSSTTLSIKRLYFYKATGNV